MKEIRLVIPDQVYDKILKVCEELGITPQDLLMRAIVKVLEEFDEVK